VLQYAEIGIAPRSVLDEIKDRCTEEVVVVAPGQLSTGKLGFNDIHGLDLRRL